MWPFRKPRQRIPYNALVDQNSGTLLAISTNAPVIAFLVQATTDTYPLYSVNFFNPDRPFPLARIRSEHYPEWTWSPGQKRFVRANAGAVTDDLRRRSRLAVEKGRIIDKIMKNLSIARYPVATGVLFQESVYLAKKAEAESFKKAGHPDADLVPYPYVVQYAEFSGLTLQQAADEILLKAKLAEDLLSRTELLRLKYFERIKLAADTDVLPAIFRSFMHECHGVAIK